MGPASAAPPGPPRLPLGTVLQGRYRLLSAIGDGAMGSVYRAERIGLDRQVAVKFIASAVARDPDFVKRFQVELRAMGRLSHPNCISVIDYGVEALPYMVMDLVDGTSLRALLAHGPLPAARALGIVRQLLAGLAHAHARGIIHRDVKPENLLLEAAVGVNEDHVRIADFGLAKLLDGASKLTLGKALGSPHYMPPEQMREGEIDHRVDIYSTGIVLYEMLTGRKPFDGATVGEILLAQRQTRPPRLADAGPGLQLSAALERVVQRALAKSPAARFASALEMQAAIEAAPELGGRGPVAAPLPAAQSAVPAMPGPGEAARPVPPLERLRDQARALARAAHTRWSALPEARRRAAMLAAGVTTAVAIVVAFVGSG